MSENNVVNPNSLEYCREQWKYLESYRFVLCHSRHDRHTMKGSYYISCLKLLIATWNLVANNVYCQWPLLFSMALYERNCSFKGIVPSFFFLFVLPFTGSRLKNLPKGKLPPACDEGQKNHRIIEYLELEGAQNQFQLPAPHRSIVAHSFT